jgi:hypothetical protein
MNRFTEREEEVLWEASRLCISEAVKARSLPPELDPACNRRVRKTEDSSGVLATKVKVGLTIPEVSYTAHLQLGDGGRRLDSNPECRMADRESLVALREIL